MKCKECKGEVNIYLVGGNVDKEVFTPVDELIAETVKKYEIPYVCGTCGSIKFRYKAIKRI